MSSRPDETEPERIQRLLRKAIQNHETSPCFIWEDRAARTARDRCFGVEPRELRALAIDHVLRRNGNVGVTRERDEEWIGVRKFDYWCSVCFLVPDAGEVFMKLALVCDDEDLPEARIVGAHASSF